MSCLVHAKHYVTYVVYRI